MAFIDKINQLEAAKAKVAELERNVTTEREQALAALPRDFGFDNLNAFIKALKSAAGKSGRGRKSAAKAAKPGKRARTKITPELKQQVIAAVQEGKSGSEIAKAFSISLPSVQNIKKEAGLVKARATAEAAPAPEQQA